MEQKSLDIINEKYIVRRNRISKEINNKISFNKILYVVAPIGYGKTIAVRNYFNEFSEKNAWHEFKEEENDIHNFIISLIKTVGNIEDIKVKRYYNMVNNITFKDNILRIVDKLALVLKDNGSKKFIVFDSFQVINDESVKNILMHFISVSPSNYKFIFLSRRKVPANFCDFIANRQVAIINSSHLDFNEEDINEFYLREGINLYSDDIKEILLNTGGWPAGMTTILMYLKLKNEGDINKILLDNEYMNVFINKNIWDTWDDRTKKFFMKISLFEDIDLDECIEITGFKEAKEILENYINIKDNKLHAINPMLLKFIKEQSKSLEDDEKVDTYKKAGECFERRCLNLEAAECYHNAKEIDKEFENIEKFCDNGMIFEKINVIERYMKNMSEEIICKNHNLCAFMIILEYINYRPEESKKWYKRLLEIKEDRIIIKEDVIAEIWKQQLKYGAYISNILPKFYGIDDSDMLKNVFAELNYEKNELNRALMEITNVHTIYRKKSNIDNIFVAYMIIHKIMCANGNIKEAKINLHKISKIVDKKKALYLINNINSTYIRFDLLNGDIKKAKEWIYENDNNKSFNLLGTYEYMTKARIYIASKQYKVANSFLETIYRLNYDYKYTSNIIECCILQAIALYKDGDEELAFSKIEEALKLAQPLGYIRIFADEGQACNDVLNKYLRSDKFNKDIEIDYIKKILSETRKFAELYPKYLKEEDMVYKVNLTKSEVQILKLIYKGMSNVDISNYLNIKKDTVKFHLRNIYSKLNVKNRMQAVQIANEIGLIK